MGDNDSREMKNALIMLRFNINNIVDERILDVVEKQCKDSQTLGYDDYNSTTYGALKDLLKNYRHKALEDIRPTVDPYMVPGYSVVPSLVFFTVITSKRTNLHHFSMPLRTVTDMVLDTPRVLASCGTWTQWPTVLLPTTSCGTQTINSAT